MGKNGVYSPLGSVIERARPWHTPCSNRRCSSALCFKHLKMDNPTYLSLGRLPGALGSPLAAEEELGLVGIDEI